ncbi:DDB1- and CUL4-associated factor 11-like isoform X2 [Littorina saxatilis]|uniref:DDB1- and CUL4-associated factor 11-like isoform X2 n=1 Tax=Littorina saxatilis TaxID=31220 RepID=UPI0038B5622C
MGSNNSRRSPNMDSDEDTDQPNPANSELPGIVAYLIRRVRACCSGQIRFVTSDNDESEGDSDIESVGPPRPPARETSPDVSSIDSNHIKEKVLRESGRWTSNKKSRLTIPTLAHLMQRREIGMDARHHFTKGDQCLVNSRFLPNRYEKLASYHHKVFCGTYSQSGDIFLSACQDQHVRIYDTKQGNFELMKTIRARDVGWSVLDVAFSPDSNYMIYSSWSDCIHLCNIHGDHDVHESLVLSPGEHSFCIFSLMFSCDNREIIGGANDGCLYIYDRESNQRTLKIDAHDDDVNCVSFADNSSQILYSGGDDGLCKVWDRRTLREDSPAPVGVMAGHVDGITYIDTKGDARYFVSNSKDQTIKLWDNRMFSPKEGVEATKKAVSSQRWDYRWQQVPRNLNRKKSVSGDTSVMTYRGHCVLHTLIRARFSPAFTTGQRYIYSGCATGSVVVYDLLTGKVVKNLDGGHRSCVRDVSWHPYENNIISSSWDGTVGKWGYFDYWAHEAEEGEEKLGEDLEEEDDGRFSYRTRRQTAFKRSDRSRCKDEKNGCFNKLYD